MPLRRLVSLTVAMHTHIMKNGLSVKSKALYLTITINIASFMTAVISVYHSSKVLKRRSLVTL